MRFFRLAPARRGRDLSKTIERLYHCDHNCVTAQFADSGSLFNLSPEAIDRILKHVSSKGFDVEKEIEPELFEHTFGVLNRALDGVFGEVQFNAPDYDFANELRYNNAVFAAFKTHAEQSELHAVMFDDKGKVRSFAEFRKASAPIIGRYNSTWLHTEYNTAIKRAQLARQMREADRNKDILPNWQWLPSTAVEPREEHKALYYKIWPLGDPFLATNGPGCLWGCLCSGRTTAAPPTDKTEIKAAIKETSPPQKGLDENPTRCGALFTASHPYFGVGGKQVHKTIEIESQKLLSSILRKEVRLYFKETLITERMISVANGPIKRLPLSYQDIKTITGKPHKFNYQRNQACYCFDDIFKVAKYEGCSPDIKPATHSHQDIARWHYYSFELNSETSYLTIKQSHDGTMRIHSIQDREHFDGNKIKEKP